MKYIFISILLVYGVLLFGNLTFASGPNDWLKDAYTKSHEPGDGEPYSVNAEAKDMFDSKIGSDSIFVRTTRYLAKIAVILAIPVLFYVAIKIALSFGDEGKMKEALKQAGYVAGGLLLALLSVMIIYLVISLTRNNAQLF